MIREAVENAVEKEIGEVKTRVVAPEYLVAIMLQTSSLWQCRPKGSFDSAQDGEPVEPLWPSKRPRNKDLMNAEKMLNDAKINKRVLLRILGKHGLREKFNALEGPL